MEIRLIIGSSNAWAEVPRSLILDLDIYDKISSRSYKRGSMVYLEQEFDFPVFLNAMTRAGRNFILSEVRIDPCPVLQYDRFR